MAAFIGEVCGNRGSVSRTGSKSSGFKATARSWDGSIRTDLFYKENKDGKEELWVEISAGQGSTGGWGMTTLYRGPFSELPGKFGVKL